MNTFVHIYNEWENDILQVYSTTEDKMECTKFHNTSPISQSISKLDIYNIVYSDYSFTNNEQKKNRC